MKRFFYHTCRIFYFFQHWRRERFTAAGRLVLYALTASAIIGLDTRMTMAYQAFTFLLILLIISIAWSFFFNIRLSINRILPKFGTAGENLTYRILIQNMTLKKQNSLYLFENLKDPRPTFEEFTNNPEPGEEHRNLFDQAVGFYRWQWLISKKQVIRIKSEPVPLLVPNEKSELYVEIIPSHRGHLRFAGCTICRPDPMGLFNALVRIPVPQSLLILPKRYSLPQMHLPGSRRFQSGGVALTSSVGDSEEFLSLRDYRPGDSLRRIHWKTWAKTKKPVVKEFQNEFFVRHALILDTFQKNDSSHSQSSFWEEQIFEEAVSVASSFACSVQTQESLLDLIFVGPEAYCFTAGRGLAPMDKILEILASVSLCKDKPFDVLPPLVIERASTLSGCICILLAWDNARKNFISQLLGLNIPVLVLVITDKTAPVLDPGPMKEKPENFYQLRLGKIQEELAKL